MIELAICVIIRNEKPYLHEWIAFHRLVGVQKFYIYDDQSEDRSIELLNKINKNDITIIPWGFGYDNYACPEDSRYSKTPQITAYNHFLKHYSNKIKWCAFIDVDEFIYHLKHDDLKEALNDPSLSGIWIPWRIFGNDGKQNKPTNLVIESYQRHHGPHRPDHFLTKGKTIIQPYFVNYFGPNGSHKPILRNNDNYHHAKFYSDWRLNHYYTKSVEEWSLKTTRYDRNAGGGQIHPDNFDRHTYNDIYDTEILKFVPKLKEYLQ